MKKRLPEIAILCALLLVVSYGFAQSWTWTTASRGPFNYLTESADGRKIMAVGSGVYISTNSGDIWNSAGFYPQYSAAGINADGSRMIVGISTNGGSLIYISTNSGVNWNPTILPRTNWFACASSGDGRVLAAAVGSTSTFTSTNGYIYTSTNFGVNWRTNTQIRSWRSLASSADGANLAAAAYNDTVYLSTNSGLTWQPSGASSTWNSIASSINGQHLIVTGGSVTAISTNRGLSWRTISMSGQGVASSADGSRLILVNGGAQITSSTNFGSSWGTTNISATIFGESGPTFVSVASSADGCELFVSGNNNDGVWIGLVPPAPTLTLGVQTNNVTLSWLVPSTNLVLQQSTDLASWLALTNVPTLNLTNYQNTVTLPFTNGSVFYSLTTP